MEYKYENLIIKTVADKDKWNDLLDNFIDANIYQTWSYAEIVQSEKIIEHVAIYERENLLAIALVRIKSIPVLKRGVAYIYRGPLWRKYGCQVSMNDFQRLLEALRLHYVEKNKYLLKLRPSIFNDNFVKIEVDQDLYLDPGSDNKIYRTLVLNLDEDLEVIRKNFKQKWRNCLNQAEKNGIEVVSGNNRELYDFFINLYTQMIQRKKFKEYVDIRKIGDMNDRLANKFKLQIFIAFKDNNPVSALVGSAMGDTGIYLLGATNEMGMKIKSAYLLQWEMIKWLKSKGIKRYDLGGIDPINNPGVFKFKVGISDKEVSDFGSFEISNNYIIKKIYDIIHLIKIKLMIFFQFIISLEESGLRVEQF